MTGKSLQLSKYGTAATADKQTSPTDTTAGALMAVGAGGFLGNADLDDGAVSDDLAQTQFIYRSQTVGGSPTGSTALGLHIEASSGGRALQVLSNPLGLYGIGFRVRNSGVWGDLNRLYHTGNILGTFSGSSFGSNDPIFEKGGDSNGEYVKFADGTMFCVREVVLDMESGNPQRFSCPETFATGAEIAGSFSGKDTGSIVTTDDRLTAHASLALIAAPSEWVARFANTATGSGMQIFTLFAKGRWY